MSKNTVFDLHPGIVMKGQLSMANDVMLTGRFEGELQTMGCLTVASGGVVTGVIEAGALVLEPGNQVEARVKVGGQPRVKIFEGKSKEEVGLWASSFKKLKELALGRK